MGDEKQNKNYNLNSINILQKQQQYSFHRSLSLSQNINKRYYHTTMHNNKGISIVMGLGAVALTAKAGQYTIQAYEEWKKNRPAIVEEEESKPEQEEQSENTTKSDTKQQEQQQQSEGGKKENIFEKWFNLSVGSKYYEGGFEDKMTRIEAALILGVRESSSVKRIKESHRKILMLNHPDTGGSNYIASKINEAKELLLKGKES